MGSELYDRLQDLRARKCALEGTLNSRPVQCPTPGCAVILVSQGATKTKCRHCGEVLCTSCSRKSHEPFTCEEHEARNGALIGKDLLRCPRCKEGCEHTGGCQFLRCPWCRVH